MVVQEFLPSTVVGIIPIVPGAPPPIITMAILVVTIAIIIAITINILVILFIG